jgi:hypothetical protein
MALYSHFDLQELTNLTTSISYFIEKLFMQFSGLQRVDSVKSWSEDQKIDFYKKSNKWSEISVYHFPQLWPSTSGIYGGFGGCAMTTYYTTVIFNRHFNIIAVFSDSNLVYCVKATEEAIKCLKSENMPSRDDLSNFEIIYKPK